MATRDQGGPRQAERLILVIEDSEEVRDLLTMILEEHGYRVETVADGREALAQTRELRPDAITLDLKLPGKGGEAIMRELQAHPDTQDIPIVVVSAFTRDLQTDARRQVSRVVPKPFYIPQIIAEVERALAER